MTERRARIRVYGSLLHFLNGIGFASGYALVFHRLRRAGPLLDAAIGAVHGAGVLVALLPIVPEVHPRMADEDEGPDPTPLVTVAAHVVYGGIVGAAYRPAH